MYIASMQYRLNTVVMSVYEKNKIIVIVIHIRLKVIHRCQILNEDVFVNCFCIAYNDGLLTVSV